MGLFSFFSRSKTEDDKKPDKLKEGEAEKHASIMIPFSRKFRTTDCVHQDQGLDELTESVAFPFANPDEGTEHDDRFFVSLGQAVPFDLSTARIQTAQRLCLRAYRKNPRAFRAIELISNFVLGEGVTIKAEDESVQESLDNFWAENNLDISLPEIVRSLGIFGEQLQPVAVNEGSGLVTLGDVSPLNIRAITANKKNDSELETVKTSVGESTSADKKGKEFGIIRPKEGELTFEGKDDAFYVVVNRIHGARRGLPDLLPAIDWLAGIDSFGIAILERANFASQVVFDIMYKGLSAEDLKDKVDQFEEALQSGATYGHNENVELKIQTPQMGASEAETIYKIMLKQIQAAVGLAGLYFGDSDDLTRASAAELSVPVAKTIQARQQVIKRMVELWCKFQIQMGQRAGVIGKDADVSFEVKMAKVFLRDLTVVTKSIKELSEALVTAQDRGWLTTEGARKLFMGAVEQLGSIDETGFKPDEEEDGGTTDGIVPPEEEGSEEEAPADEATAGDNGVPAPGATAGVSG